MRLKTIPALLALVVLLFTLSAYSSENLLPLDKLKPFSVTFEGEKSVEGRGPSYPWFATKWQKDKAGFVSFGELADGGVGVTIWSDAKYGPSFWLNPIPIPPGVYRMSFDVKSVGSAPWRLRHKVDGAADGSLVEFKDMEGALANRVEGIGRVHQFDANPLWRTVNAEITLRSEGGKYNFDLALAQGGGREQPVYFRNFRLEKIREISGAEVAEATEKARAKRLKAQLADYYGTVTGVVLSSQEKEVTLKVKSLYPYTRLDSSEALAGSELIVRMVTADATLSEEEARNLRGTTPVPEQASAFLSSLKEGEVVELGVFGDVSTGQAKLMRLPGPTTVPYGSTLPAYMGASVDESKATTTLYVSGKQGLDSNDGRSSAESVATIERAFALAVPLLDAGTGVRIVIAPGIYRPVSTLRLSEYEDPSKSLLAQLSSKAREAVLIVEGSEKEGVIIRGSITKGFEANTWELVDAEKKIYRHRWTKDYGKRSEGYYRSTTKDARLHRRELVALNGQLLENVLLEDMEWVDPSGITMQEDIGLVTGSGKKVTGQTGYVSKGFRHPVVTLQPGQFGVVGSQPKSEDPGVADSLFLRLPKGMVDLRNALIEIGSLQTLLRIQDKSNLVLRNLTFEHSGAWYNAYYEKAAIDTNPWASFSDSRNWLWENITARQNNSQGAMVLWVRNATFRNCRFIENGNVGLRLSFVNEFVVEDSAIDRNNTLGKRAEFALHGAGGMDFTGQNTAFRRVTFNHNFGRGVRSDYGLEDVIFEDCVVVGNEQHGGVFHEIEFGPVSWRYSRIAHNTGADRQGIGLLAVNRVNIENCVLHDNEGGQINFYVSPKRHRMLEMLPLGWFKTASKQKGYDFVGISDDPFSPRGRIEQFTLEGSVVSATGKNYLIGRWAGVGDAKAYGGLIRSEDFKADGNTYWNPDSPLVFEDFTDKSNYQDRVLVDFETWKTITGQDKNSVWQAPIP